MMQTKLLLPHKTIACSVDSTTRNLTQPTEWTADWAGIDYTKPVFLRPGGIPSGRFRLASRGACESAEKENVC